MPTPTCGGIDPLRVVRAFELDLMVSKRSSNFFQKKPEAQIQTTDERRSTLMLCLPPKGKIQVMVPPQSAALPGDGS
jgi:hypothetical protein